MNASPAPTVSTTTPTRSATARASPAAQNAIDPRAPFVTTTIAGPDASQLRAVRSGSASGRSQLRSSSLNLTTSLRSTRRSMRARAKSGSPINDGRTLGSRVTVADAQYPSTSSATAAHPGSRTAAMDPVCTSSGGATSGVPSRRQSRSKA